MLDGLERKVFRVDDERCEILELEVVQEVLVEVFLHRRCERDEDVEGREDEGVEREWQCLAVFPEGLVGAEEVQDAEIPVLFLLVVDAAVVAFAVAEMELGDLSLRSCGADGGSGASVCVWGCFAETHADLATLDEDVDDVAAENERVDLVEDLAWQLQESC